MLLPRPAASPITQVPGYSVDSRRARHSCPSSVSFLCHRKNLNKQFSSKQTNSPAISLSLSLSLPLPPASICSGFTMAQRRNINSRRGHAYDTAQCQHPPDRQRLRYFYVTLGFPRRCLIPSGLVRPRPCLLPPRGGSLSPSAGSCLSKKPRGPKKSIATLRQRRHPQTQGDGELPAIRDDSRLVASSEAQSLRQY